MAHTSNNPPFSPSAVQAGTSVLRPGAAAHRVAMLGFAGMQPIDVSGPLQAFCSAAEEAPSRGTSPPLYQPLLVGEAGAGAALPTASGFAMLAEAGLEALEAAETVLIPGGPGVFAAAEQPAMLSALRAAAARGARIGSICTGAFLLGSTGLLDGRRATTHWRAAAALATAFPAVIVDATPIYLCDQGIWSSAGVTAGIDLALALIEADHGAALAAAVARRLVVYLRRPGSQAQFSAPLALQQAAADLYGPLLAQVEAALAEPWSVDRLAALAGEAPRSFQRHFTARTGMPPATAVEQLRLARARLLLESTDLPQAIVATRCGFGGVERMRRAFHRQTGGTPGALRARFGMPAPAAPNAGPAPDQAPLVQRLGPHMAAPPFQPEPDAEGLTAGALASTTPA